MPTAIVRTPQKSGVKSNRKVYSIDEIKERIENIAKDYEIEEAYLFGSYAYGSATPESDIDIFIKEGKIRTLIQLCGFRLDVQDALNKDVDVVVEGSQNVDLERNIKKEMLKIYG